MPGSGPGFSLGVSPGSQTASAAAASYTASFSAQTGNIQGYKVSTLNTAGYGSPFNNPGATITVDGAQQYGPGVNPYGGVLVNAGNHTVSSSVPAGYAVSSSVCANCTNHPASSYVAGTSVTVTAPASGYIDLYWQYVSTAPCKQQNFVSGTTTPSSVNPSAAYQVFCDYGVNSSNVAGNNCNAFANFQGTGSLFNCTAPSAPGNYAQSCQLIAGRRRISASVTSIRPER